MLNVTNTYTQYIKKNTHINTPRSAKIKANSLFKWWTYKWPNFVKKKEKQEKKSTTEQRRKLKLK